MAKNPQSVNRASILDVSSDSLSSYDWREALVKELATTSNQAQRQSVSGLDSLLSNLTRQQQIAQSNQLKIQQQQAKQQRDLENSLAKIKKAEDLPPDFISAVPSFANSLPVDWNEMGYENKIQAYDNYLNETANQVKMSLTASPIPITEIKKAINSLNAEYKPTAPERQLGIISTVGDVASGLAAGLVETVGGLASAVVPGDTSDIIKATETTANFVRDLQSDVAKEAAKDAAYDIKKRELEYQAANNGEDMGWIDSTVSALKSYKDNFSAADLGNIIGMIGTSISGGGLVAKGAAKGASLLSKTANTTGRLGKARNALAFSAGSAITPAGQGGMNAANQILNTPLETLANSEEFNNYVAEYQGDVEKAKYRLASEVSEKVTQAQLILGTIANVIPGSWGNRFINPTSNTAKTSLLRRLANAAGAGGIAAGDAAAEQAASNYVVNAINPEIGLSDEVGFSSVLGFALGGTLGAVGRTSVMQKLNPLEVKADAAKAVAEDLGVASPKVETSEDSVKASGKNQSGNEIEFETDGTTTRSKETTPEGDTVALNESTVNSDGSVTQSFDRFGFRMYQQDIDASDGLITIVQTNTGADSIVKQYVGPDDNITATVDIARIDGEIKTIKRWEGSTVVNEYQPAEGGKGFIDVLKPDSEVLDLPTILNDADLTRRIEELEPKNSKTVPPKSQLQTLQAEFDALMATNPKIGSKARKKANSLAKQIQELSANEKQPVDNLQRQLDVNAKDGWEAIEKSEAQIRDLTKQLTKATGKAKEAIQIKLNKELSNFNSVKEDILFGADGTTAKQGPATSIRDIVTNINNSAVDRQNALDLYQLYTTLDLPLPKVKITSQMPDNVRGVYHPRYNTIEAKPDISAQDLIHEYAHGLTHRGVLAYEAIARGNSVEKAQAKNILSAGNKILKAMRIKGDELKLDSSALYGVTSLSEALAEVIANPVFRGVADNTTLSRSGFTKAELDSLEKIGVRFSDSAKSQNKVNAFKAVYNIVKNALRKLFGATTPKYKATEVLNLLQQEFSSPSAIDQFNTLSKQLAEVTYNQSAYMLANPDIANNPGKFINDIKTNGGKIKTFQHTTNAKFLRDLYNDIKTGAGVRNATAKRMQEKAVSEKLNTMFFDSLHPMVVEFDKLAAREPHLKPTLDNTINGLRTMSDKANQFKSHLEPLQDNVLKVVVEAAKKMDMDVEEAMSTLGYYLTARHHENAYQKVRRNLDYAEAQLVDEVSKAKGNTKAKLTRDLTKLRDDITKFEAAYNNPDVNATHDIELPAGMSKAQAAEMKRVTGANIPPELKTKLKKTVSKLVSNQLMLEISEGTTRPDVVARFLGRPNLEQELDDFLKLKKGRDSSLDDAARKAYDDEFNRLAKELENDYVPYSTYLEDTLGGEGLLTTKDNILRSSATQKMMGSRTIPADGLSSVFANITRAANRYGQKELLTSLHRLYTQLDHGKLLKTVGMTRLEVTPANMALLHVGENAGILAPGKKGDPSYIYAFENPNINKALNKTLSNSLPGNSLANKVLRTMVGSMTQYNPLFHITQYFRNRQEMLDAGAFRIHELGLENEWKQIEREVTRKMWFGKTLQDTFNSVVRGKKSTAVKDMLELSAINARYADIFDVRRNTDIVKRIKNIKSPTRQKMAAVGEFLSRMNHATDIAPKVAIFEALVNRGISKEKAARFVRDIADFGKSGDLAKTSYGKSIAFFRPAFVGLDSVRRGFTSSDPQVRKRAYSRMLKRVMFYAMVEGAYRSLVGEDDTRSEYERTAYTHIPLGDSIIRLPVAYGVSRAAKAMAGMLFDFSETDKTIAEATLAALDNGLMKNFSPIDLPEVNLTEHPIDALFIGFSPTVIKPFVMSLANTNNFGKPIAKEKNVWELGVPYYQLSQAEMAPAYTELSKWFLDVFGLDVNPGYFKFFVDQFTPGVTGEVRKQLIDNPNLQSIGREPTTKLPLFISSNKDAKNRALYYKLFYRAQKVAKRVELKGEDYIPTADEEAAMTVYENIKSEFNELLKDYRKDIKNAESQTEAKAVKQNMVAAENDFMDSAVIRLKSAFN